jgi:hypothetical protein
MDSFRETTGRAVGIVRAAKWIGAGIVLFFTATCTTWGELVYVVSGQEARATITEVREVRTKKTDVLTGLRVGYSFVEAGGRERRGYQEVSTDWVIPAGGTVMVQYTAVEDGSSRFVGHVPWFWLVVFFASAAFVVGGFLVLTQEGREALRREKSQS